MKTLSLISIASLLAVVAAQAQTTINWDGGGDDNLWSNQLNWAGDNVPDNNGEAAAFTGGANLAINITQDYTINNYTDGFGGEGFTHTLYGAGVLTIDRNNSTTQPGLTNGTGSTGGTFRLNGKITIQNSLNGITTLRNSNSASNIFLLDTGSSLTINTVLQTIAGTGGTINMNGKLIASAANLQINSTNVSFGAGHDSSAFGRDIVLLANSKLAVDGGTVLNINRKFQVNGNAELELNGADAINKADIVVGGANNLLLDVNSNQSTMGTVLVTDGVLTIDVDAAVTGLWFLNSSAKVWGAGSIAITGFKEGVIRFGTDANGLTAGQLEAINGGIYSLTSSGYLTTGAEVTAPIGVAVAVSGPDMELTFDSVAGTTYTLYKSSDLGAAFPAGWTSVTSQAASGGPLTLIDAGGKPAAGASIFYRIEASTTP